MNCYSHRGAGAEAEAGAGAEAWADAEATAGVPGRQLLSQAFVGALLGSLIILLRGVLH